MKGARWLLLAAMALIVTGVSLTYRAQKKSRHDDSPPVPAELPAELNSAAQHWQWTETDAQGCKTANIEAEDFRQVKDSSRVDLKGVGLKLYKHCSDTYDLVKSAAASFFTNEHRLYSEGDVEITLGVPTSEPAKADLVSIRSSGVTFDSNTGRADTEHASQFRFRNGDGQSTGASYDPTTRELVMKKDVVVHRHPATPNGKSMTIEADGLTYLETKAEIHIPLWGKLTRDATVMEGQESVIHLRDGVLQEVSTNHARGGDEYPKRKLQYSADALLVTFDEDGEVQKINGQGNAHLVTTSEGSETTVVANWVEMRFAPQEEESILTSVDTAGKSSVTSKPLPVAGRQPAETEVLRSERISVKMRPGGKEIENLTTYAPSQLEFLPSLATQRHRILDGSYFVIAYGPQNRIDSFRAQDVKTLTDPSGEERQRNPAQTITASKELRARFEPGSSRLSTMEQAGDFTYREGDRRARAVKATLDSASNVMLLDTAARVWDPSGSTSADHIRLDQRTGNFKDEGGVKSSRVADSNPKNRNGMLSGDEPLEAQARKMESTNRNRTIHYEGNVSLWQGANRIQANVVDVDREKQTLVADGNVISDLWEQPKDPAKKAATPVMTVVRAPHLVYTDQNRLATYTGGARLERPGLQVKSRELRAFLADASADSRLEKALADGAVEIVQQGAPARTRTGTAEHGEYYPDEQKVVLRGGKPQMVDSLKGDTHGDELTYFANDDRLLVNGSPDQPAKSRIRRK